MTVNHQDYQMRVTQLGEEDGYAILVEYPDLPGCMSHGACASEAAKNAIDAFNTWVKRALLLGRLIPAPSFEPELFEEDDLPLEIKNEDSWQPGRQLQFA